MYYKMNKQTKNRSLIDIIPYILEYAYRLEWVPPHYPNLTESKTTD
jgi:hypothetical protein